VEHPSGSGGQVAAERFAISEAPVTAIGEIGQPNTGRLPECGNSGFILGFALRHQP
jgi:hypothetical protein